MRIVKGMFGFLLAIQLCGCMGPMMRVQTTLPANEFITRTITLVVNSEPAGARIYQEGIFEGTTPLTLKFDFALFVNHLSIGGVNYWWQDEGIVTEPSTRNKSLTAVLDGYRPQTRQYAFKPDEVGRTDSFSMLFALEQDARAGQQQQQQQTVIIPTDGGGKRNYGSLNIISTPPQAEIYIDGSFVATTPASNLQLEVGQHKIVIQKAGYRQWLRTLQVLPASPVTIEIVLEKL